MIVVIDYGLGNPASARNMLRKAGVDALVTADPLAIAAAEKLILPGVGAFDHGMQNLADRGLIPVLNEAVLGRKVPVLGICLGMQLISRGSDEGVKPGLGWLAADTVRFDVSAAADLRVPHMGWNTVMPGPAGQAGSLLGSVRPNEYFYFVHSYFAQPANPGVVGLITDYGGPFAAAISVGNCHATQFHPEKSQQAGSRLLEAFATL